MISKLKLFTRPACFLLSGVLAIYAALAGYLMTACDTPELGFDEANLFVLFSVYVPFIPLAAVLGILWLSWLLAKKLQHIPVTRCLLRGFVLIVSSGLLTSVVTQAAGIHEKCGGYVW